jgi:CRISPR-associated protein Csm3
MKELLKDGIFYSEVKAEVIMDRVKGTVAGAGPRSMDRIMAGTKLDFRLTVRVLEGDDEDQMKAALLHAFHLLEMEGLGGSVSRGYGQVRFDTLTWDGADVSKELHPEPAAA